MAIGDSTRGDSIPSDGQNDCGLPGEPRWFTQARFEQTLASSRPVRSTPYLPWRGNTGIGRHHSRHVQLWGTIFAVVSTLRPLLSRCDYGETYGVI